MQIRESMTKTQGKKAGNRNYLWGSQMLVLSDKDLKAIIYQYVQRIKEIMMNKFIFLLNREYQQTSKLLKRIE